MTASSVARRSVRDNQAQVRRRQLLTRVAPDPHDLAIVMGAWVLPGDGPGAARSDLCRLPGGAGSGAGRVRRPRMHQPAA
jgi:hypothetical protein